MPKNNKECPNPCCTQKFSDNRKLVRHMQLYPDCKVYLLSCTGCSDRFATREHLTNHHVFNRYKPKSQCVAQHNKMDIVTTLSVNESTKTNLSHKVSSITIEQATPSRQTLEQSAITWNYKESINDIDTSYFLDEDIVKPTSKKRKYDDHSENFGLTSTNNFSQHTQLHSTISTSQSISNINRLHNEQSQKQIMVNTFLSQSSENNNNGQLILSHNDVTVTLSVDPITEQLHIVQSEIMNKHDKVKITKKQNENDVYTGMTSGGKKSYTIQQTTEYTKNGDCASHTNFEDYDSTENVTVPEDMDGITSDEIEYNVVDEFNFPVDYFDTVQFSNINVNDVNVQDTSKSNKENTQYILDRCEEIFRTKNQTMFDKSEECLFELYNMHKKSCAPIGLFDKTLKWMNTYISQFVEISNGTIKMVKLPSRESFVKRMYKRVYGADNISKVVPKLVDVKLEKNSSVSVKATLFDFREVLIDMLTDSEIMNTDNQDWYNRSDPFEPYPLTHPIMSPHQSYVARRAHERLCKEPNDVAWGIELYNDEINFDKNGKLSLDPWSMCFTRLKRRLRNQPWAWRMFGIVHGVDSTIFNKTLSSEKKAEIYQKVLQRLFKEVKQIQKEGGIPWKLKFGNKIVEVKIIPYIQFIIGDTKGHDAMCGRMNSHTDGMKQGCRDCDVPHEQMQNIYHQCRFREISDFQSLSIREYKDKSFHPIGNAFSNLEMGDEVHGIYGATVAEVLHVFYMGLLKYATTHFIDSLSAPNVLLLDQAVTNLIRQLDRQSGKQLVPEGLNSFRHGLSKVSLLTGKQAYCKIMVMYLALSCSDCVLYMSTSKKKGLGVHESLGTQYLQSWYNLFESTLIFIEWLKQESFSVEELYNNSFLINWEKYLNGEITDIPINDNDMVEGSPAQLRVLEYMKEYYALVCDREGQGLNIPKFHFVKHLIRNICRHGPPMDVDGSRNESNASVLGKCPGLRTQMHHKTISIHTANRYHEDLTILKAEAMFHNHCGSKQFSVFENDVVQIRKDGVGGSRYIFKLIKRPNIISERQVTSTIEWNGKNSLQRLNDEMLQCLTTWLWVDHIGGCISKESTVYGYTELYKDNHLYRCHPSYNSESEWYDWVYVNWDSNSDPIPAKLYMVFDLSCCDFITDKEARTKNGNIVSKHSSTMRPIVEDPADDYVTKHKLWVVVHSAISNDFDHHSQANPSCCFTSKIAKRVNMERNQFRVIPAESIVGPCFGMMNFSLTGKEGNLFDDTAVILSPKKDWPKKFINNF